MSSTVSAVVRFGTCDCGLSIASLFFPAGVQGLGSRVEVCGCYESRHRAINATNQAPAIWDPELGLRGVGVGGRSMPAEGGAPGVGEPAWSPSITSGGCYSQGSATSTPERYPRGGGSTQQ